MMMSPEPTTFGVRQETFLEELYSRLSRQLLPMMVISTHIHMHTHRTKLIKQCVPCIDVHRTIDMFSVFCVA